MQLTLGFSHFLPPQHLPQRRDGIIIHLRYAEAFYRVAVEVAMFNPYGVSNSEIRVFSTILEPLRGKEQDSVT